MSKQVRVWPSGPPSGTPARTSQLVLSCAQLLTTSCATQEHGRMRRERGLVFLPTPTNREHQHRRRAGGSKQIPTHSNIEAPEQTRRPCRGGQIRGLRSAVILSLGFGGARMPKPQPTPAQTTQQFDACLSEPCTEIPAQPSHGFIVFL